MEAINNLGIDPWLEAFGSVVEHFPALAAAAFRQRPYANPGQLADALDREMDKLSDDRETVLFAYFKLKFIYVNNV